MTLRLLRDAFTVLRWRMVLLFGLVAFASLVEGLGLSLLFPLLSKFRLGASSGQSALLQRKIDEALRILGIPNEFTVLLAIAVGVMLLQVALQAARAWSETDCQTRYTVAWQRRLFDAFIRAEWGFFTKEKAATRVNAILVESGRIAAALSVAVRLVTSASLILVYGTISVLGSWQMVLFLACFGGAIYLVMRPMSRLGYAIGEQVTAVNDALQHRTMEFIQSAKLIKASATEPLAEALFRADTETYRKVFRRAGFHAPRVLAIYMGAGYLLLGVGMWLAVQRWQVDPAVILVSIYVFLRLYVQLSNLQQLRQSLLMSIPALPNAERQYKAALAMQERAGGGKTVPEGPASVRFAKVGAQYDRTVVLSDVSFTIEPGEMVGITGPSGAGKSTLVDLVAGLIKPSQGDVLIDGMPLAELSVRDWRRSIGYVAQDTLLFDGTVADNISWGGSYTAAEIEAAARAASAHSFIGALPNGYDTEVGGRGVRLSGGQRQRLGLARALIGNKRLLILDEATSAVDIENERAILGALAELKGEVTILIVTHRLGVLAESDRILVFDGGRLVESDTWDRLVGSNGYFSRLLRMQDSNRVPA